MIMSSHGRLLYNKQQLVSYKWEYGKTIVPEDLYLDLIDIFIQKDLSWVYLLEKSIVVCFGNKQLIISDQHDLSRQKWLVIVYQYKWSLHASIVYYLVYIWIY